MTKFPDDDGAKNTAHWGMRIDPDLKEDIKVHAAILKSRHKKDMIEAIRQKIREVVEDAKRLCDDKQEAS